MQRGADFQQLARERVEDLKELTTMVYTCLLYTSPSPRDPKTSRMPSSA